MAKWVDLGPGVDFPAGGRRSLRVGPLPVVVFHLPDGYRAIVNICPHAGLPLGEGELRGCVLTCPFHGYAYDVKTGRNIDFPEVEQPVRTLPVQVTEGGVVQVDVEGAG